MNIKLRCATIVDRSSGKKQVTFQLSPGQDENVLSGSASLLVKGAAAEGLKDGEEYVLQLTPAPRPQPKKADPKAPTDAK